MSDTAVDRLPRHSRWQRSYAQRLFITDLIVVISAVYGSQLIWFGFQPVQLDWTVNGGLEYSIVSAILIVTWMLAMEGYDSRDHKVVGSGTLEYKRVADATLRFFGIFAIVAYVLGIGLGRGYFLTALPVGLGLLIFSRWLWRQWLRSRQATGAYLSRTVLVGERKKSVHVAKTIRRAEGTGLLLVGAFTKGGRTEKNLWSDVPVIGDFASILPIVDQEHIERVILTGADDINPSDMRQLGWDLDARGVDLIVAPALTDIAGPRIHAQPVAGLPLIHVEYPTLEGTKRVSKRTFDIVGSVALILVSSPVLIGVAIAIRVTSPGSIFYTQQRIGRRGKPFGMFKFRSMHQDADDQLESLLDAQGTTDKPLFKVMNDPRITPVGKFIRRYSLDEFPQLLNVLLGHMSLVGPRPQRAAEVALYDGAAHRRLIMKPGMSGLWQVSGRSNLSWEDSIRLDLYYVENWSMTADILILFRTVRAVATTDGAV